MLCIHNPQTDPTYNLAAEEYLLKDRQENFFMLWRNRPSIIVGKHQNANAEINIDFVRKNNIDVVRRMSGGGAVFHDLGNINYTFIQNAGEGAGIDFERYTAPILEVLHDLDIDARFEGRNDLTIDGRKFSGNAQYIFRNRILHHGTLLFSSQITDLSEALKVNPLKYSDRAIKSVRSRVTNISEHLSQSVDVLEFIKMVMDYIVSHDERAERYKLTEEDSARIREYQKEKYATWEWNFGTSPRYGFRKASKTAGGHVEVHMNVDKGVIQDIRILGDFFAQGEVCDVENGLVGTPHDLDTILKRMRELQVENCFVGVTVEDLSALMF